MIPVGDSDSAHIREGSLLSGYIAIRLAEDRPAVGGGSGPHRPLNLTERWDTVRPGLDRTRVAVTQGFFRPATGDPPVTR